MTTRHDRSRRERWRAVYVGCAREEVFLLDVAEARQVQRSPQIQRRRRLRVIMGRGDAFAGMGPATTGMGTPAMAAPAQRATARAKSEASGYPRQITDDR